MFRACKILGPGNRLSLLGGVSVRILTEFCIVVGSLEALDSQGAASKTEGRLHGLGQTLFPVTSATEPVNTDIDVVAEVLVQCGWVFKRGLVAVDPPVEIALFDELTEQLDVGAFSRPDNRTPHRDAMGFHAPEDVVNNLLNRSTSHFFAARRTVRLADSSPQQT